MKKKTKPAKGEYNYIHTRKRTQLLMTFFYVCIGFLIFMLGLLLNKFESTNLFTIIAFLMVLPATKRFIGFIVLFPYRSVKEELYRTVFSLKQEADLFYTDAVFTSTEKIMFLSFLTVSGHTVMGLLGNEKQDAAYIKRYLEEGIRKRHLPYTVEILKNTEDFIKKYKKRTDADSVEAHTENLEELKAFLYSILVQ